MSNNNKDEFKQLVELTTERLGLIQPGVIEKDYYVTQALHAVSDIETDYFRLAFQGGTCLSKAHRLIDRMSEDCDLRIQAKPETYYLSKEVKRKQLREFRHKLVAALKSKCSQNSSCSKPTDTSHHQLSSVELSARPFQGYHAISY